MNSYELIKNQIDIKSYIVEATGIPAVRVGDSSWGINPCPFCGHNDCFRINTNLKIFKCFSCGKGGDPIKFTKEFYNLSSTYEAIRLLASKYNISMDDDELASYLTVIDITAKAVEYYHSVLLENPSALNYFTEERKHSLEVIKRFKLGYSDGKLTAYLRELGYKAEDIKKAGLCKSGTKDFIEEGIYVYPYFRFGLISHLKAKLRNPKKVYETKADSKCLFYNQDVLYESDEVILVEGEDDLITIIDKTGTENVIAIGGNLKNKQVIYLKNSNLKRLYLCFDNDDKGEAYTNKICIELKDSDTELRIIRFSSNLIDIDGFLLASNNPKEDFKKLINEAIIPPDISSPIKEKKNCYYILKSTKDGGLEYKKISNFTIRIKNKLIYKDSIKREVYFKNGNDKSEVFILESDCMPNARSFKEFCLSKGNFVFEGTDNDLNELWKYEFSKDTGKKIYLVDEVGYSYKNELWLFENLAVKKGKILLPDDSGVFWLKDGQGIKINPLSKNRPLPKLILPEESFNVGKLWIDIETALNGNIGGFKGCLILGYTVATVYSYEIFKEFKLFPILFIYGKFRSGKNIFGGYIMNFFGLDMNFATSAQENSQTGISRMLNYYSYIPMWIDEYRSSERKIKAMDGFFRNVYNKVAPVKAKRSDYGIRDVEIKGNLILSGEEMPTDPALRSRCFSVNLSEKERDDSIYPEVIKLSKGFSKITAKLIANKNVDSTKKVIDTIYEYKNRFLKLKVDSRQAEVYATIIGSRMAIDIPGFDREAFIEWVKNQLLTENQRRVEESTLNLFWEATEGLMSRGEININTHIQIDPQSRKVFIWFAEVYRICERDFRFRRSDNFPSKQTILDHLSEEPYFMDKNFSKRFGSTNRNCVVLNLDNCPDFIKNMAESII